MATKIERHLRKMARRHDRTLVLTSGSAHYHLICNRGERRLVVAALTPKNLDNTLKNVERDLKKSEDPQ